MEINSGTFTGRIIRNPVKKPSEEAIEIPRNSAYIVAFCGYNIAQEIFIQGHENQINPHFYDVPLQHPENVPMPRYVK